MQPDRHTQAEKHEKQTAGVKETSKLAVSAEKERERERRERRRQDRCHETQAARQASWKLKQQQQKKQAGNFI